MLRAPPLGFVLALLAVPVHAPPAWTGDQDFPPLLSGLPASNLAEQRAVTPRELERRARARLPVGTPEAQAAAALGAEQFRDEGRNAAGRRWFVFRRDNFPCEESYRIGWRADGAGRIEAVETRFHTTCD